LRQVDPRVNRVFHHIDSQALRTSNFDHAVSSLRTRLEQNGFPLLPLSAATELSVHLLHEIREYLHKDANLNLCLLIDEFHQFFLMPADDRVQFLRFIKSLSGIARLRLFISSTCMLPVLFHATQIAPNGFAFANNCYIVMLPSRVPPRAFASICTSALDYVAVNPAFSPSAMSTAIEKSGLAKTAATAFFVAMSLPSDPKHKCTISDLFKSCGALKDKIVDELSQECQQFLRLLPPEFRKLLHAVTCSPLNPPAASDFCNFFPSKTSYPLLYLRLLADESMPLHSLQSKVMGLRGYYGAYVRSMIRASDGEVLDSLAFRPDASTSILGRINECRYYIVDSALASDTSARQALNKKLKPLFPNSLKSEEDAKQWPLFRLLWSDQRNEKPHLVSLRQDWRLAWPTQDEVYVQFVGKVIGHRFAHPGNRGYSFLFNSIIRLNEYATLLALIDTAHPFCVEWTFRDGVLPASSPPPAEDVDVSTSIFATLDESD